jgi:aspartate beta-hydroxylase
VAENAARWARSWIAAGSLAANAGHQALERMRFDRCLDRMLGRRRIYVPEPTLHAVPVSGNYEFFDRAHFPWLETLEAATDCDTR